MEKKPKESVRNAKKDLSVAYFDIRNEWFTESMCRSHHKVCSRPLQNLAWVAQNSFQHLDFDGL